MIEEGSLTLPLFVSGLEVESFRINVRSITQESPLRELLLVSLFLAFQKNLETEVPAMIDGITGQHIPDGYDTILTLVVLIALFYGAGYVKDVVTRKTVDSPLRRQLKAMVADLASRTGKTESEINDILAERYKPKSRIANLADAAIRFFRPSKSQQNAPILVGNKRIETQTVADIPDDYVYEEEQKAVKSEPFQNLKLDIHAQDRDKENVGWAAIAAGITGKRLRMKLMDGVTPDQLWNRDTVTGDGQVIYKRVGMDFIASEIHLTRIRD